MEVIQYPSRHDVVLNYDFPKEKSNQIGAKWFISPLEAQLKRFVNGLGKIIYFVTQERDLNITPYMDIEPLETRTKFLYEMVTDIVLYNTTEHPDGCQCGCMQKDEYNFMKLDGYDDCYLGVGDTYGEHPALVYDHTKIIEKLMQSGMDLEDAEEYYSYNILGSFLGEKMPIFLHTSVRLDDLNTK